MHCKKLIGFPINNFSTLIFHVSKIFVLYLFPHIPLKVFTKEKNLSRKKKVLFGVTLATAACTSVTPSTRLTSENVSMQNTSDGGVKEAADPPLPSIPKPPPPPPPPENGTQRDGKSGEKR
ncbi:hypothetical protein CEXT_250841 [Caerostris extrusa]|uniref:Uncharacterized protein n=1 Tax=Caerostris extrusa TaxID=172846 RepID=A0AAV4TAX1_CAEEX|nr:hypothetical protein CEXT_250841 [Caerostris extrusa]